MDFAEKLVMTRKMQGLSQIDLAKKAGISHRTITAYEKGESSPRPTNVVKLADALCVSGRYLTDPNCLNPLEGLDNEKYVSAARSRYGKNGAMDMQELLDANNAVFAGGEYSETQKEQFMRAIMELYFQSKKAASKKYGSRKEQK